MKTKLMLSALIVFVAIQICFLTNNVVSILSYGFLSILLIYIVFREKDIKEKD